MKAPRTHAIAEALFPPCAGRSVYRHTALYEFAIALFRLAVELEEEVAQYETAWASELLKGAPCSLAGCSISACRFCS